MNQPQPITDTQIDALIETAKPAIRNMIRDVFSGVSPCNFLEIGKMPLPTGQEWQVVICIMNEAFAAVAAPTLLTGIPGLMDAYKKATTPATAPPPSPGGFSIPGA